MMQIPLLRHRAALFALALLLGPLWMPAADAARPRGVDTESIYTRARGSLLQIRTLLKQTGNQSSIGSGFVVRSDGLAITNYHVVSEFALQPTLYTLHWANTEGREGELDVVALDIENDLALVRLRDAQAPARPLRFSEPALRGRLTKGQRLYAMGNPLDLGFTIVEGTYNGPVERSYAAQMHFTGAINPGMSGGPAVTPDGRVAGINVARRVDSQLVSFLVPARHAQALLAAAGDRAPPDPATLKTQIGEALVKRSAALYAALQRAGFRSVLAAPLRLPESEAPWFTCWSQTNADEVPAPKVRVDATRCTADSSVFVSEDLGSGAMQLSHMSLDGSRVNAFQFASELGNRYQPLGTESARTSRNFTHARCHEEFVSMGDAQTHPPLRASWCASAYRDFPGLYDVSLVAVTQAPGAQAGIVRLHLSGAPYDAALVIGRTVLESVTWAR